MYTVHSMAVGSNCAELADGIVGSSWRRHRIILFNGVLLCFEAHYQQD